MRHATTLTSGKRSGDLWAKETTPALPRHSDDKAQVCNSRGRRDNFLEVDARSRDDYTKEKRDFVTSHQSAARSGPDTQTVTSRRGRTPAVRIRCAVFSGTLEAPSRRMVTGRSRAAKCGAASTTVWGGPAHVMQEGLHGILMAASRACARILKHTRVVDCKSRSRTRGDLHPVAFKGQVRRQ